MRKIFCDMCGAEITTDIVFVFDHELCPDCVKAVDDFISAGRHPIHTEGIAETNIVVQKTLSMCETVMRKEE